MTLAETIKKYCLECMNGSKKEVELCPSKQCSLYKFRMGDKKGGEHAIINKCNDCMELPNRCQFNECPLHPHNPN